MEPNTFLIAWRGGNWRIGYDGQWYGSYESVVAAVVSAVRIARSAPETQVIVQRENGSETLIWNGRSASEHRLVWR
jgi:hypothetical protein